MQLYSKEDLEFIKGKLKSGEMRFSLREFRMFFSKKENIYIQHVSNFALGLAYNVELDEFYFNYPHINNVRDEKVVNGFVQGKRNGTNLGFLPINKNGDLDIVFRTRGSIFPERFINDINTRILSCTKTVLGINENVFQQFACKYKPILQEGQEKGYVDDFGNFVLERVTNELVRVLRPLFSSGEIIGIFGELISKYNPIAVDGEMKFGMYLDMKEDFQYVIFDILRKDEEGNVFLDFTSNGQLARSFSSPYVSYVETIPLTNLVKSVDLFPIEEGIVVKNKDQYLKFKREDVITWERMMGKLSNVLFFSVDHIFSQGLGFSDEEIFERKILTQEGIIDGIINQVWQEVFTNGVTRKNLIEYFATKNMKEYEIDNQLRDNIYKNLMLLVSATLKKFDIKKEVLYKEIPQYIKFHSEPLYFHEKRKKLVATIWYGKMIGNVIGKVYCKSEN